MSPNDDDFYFSDAFIEINNIEREATAGTVTVTVSGTDLTIEVL
ncbi:hypothetical protein [Dokdonia sp. Hel_I_53]|nr:hypothetical protein [Dokdonia sp. Hel_I_53]